MTQFFVKYSPVLPNAIHKSEKYRNRYPLKYHSAGLIESEVSMEKLKNEPLKNEKETLQVNIFPFRLFNNNLCSTTSHLHTYSRQETQRIEKTSGKSPFVLMWSSICGSRELKCTRCTWFCIWINWSGHYFRG